MRLSALFALDAFAGGLIVQSLIAYWFHVKYGVDTGVSGKYLFWREYSGGHIRVAGCAARKEVWIDQHDGLHAHSVESFVDARAADAEPAAGDRRFAGAFQHFADGCADASIVYDGGGGAG